MPVATVIPAIIGAAGIGSSIYSGISASNAARNAANTQANSANYAANLSYQASQDALAEQQRQFNTAQEMYRPAATAGTLALNELLAGLGIQIPGFQPGSYPTGGNITSAGSAVTQQALQDQRQSLQNELASLNQRRYATQQVSPAAAQALSGVLDPNTIIGLRESGAGQPPTSGLSPDPYGTGTNSEQTLYDTLFGPYQMAQNILPTLNESMNTNTPTAIQDYDAEISRVQAALSEVNTRLETGDYASSGGSGGAQTTAPVDPNNPSSYFGSPGQAISFGQFVAPFQYNPNADPSTQFRLAEGQKALERGAAARGSVLGGAALKELTRYAQDFASTEYNNAFNRFQTEQTDLFNRYASLAGLGQTASNAAAATGQNYANSVSNILTGTASNMGDYATQAGNARASGYIGGANAWNQALNNLVGGSMDIYTLTQLLGRQQ
jgi:hypothetical protein